MSNATTSSSPQHRLDQWLLQEQAQFSQNHPISASLQQQCMAHFLFGVPMHWMRDWPTPFGLFIHSAQGIDLTCADGRHYLDFCLGDTGAMFGHSLPPIAQALAAQAAKGLTCMLPSTASADVGAALAQVFGLPQWQMALSASDANRFVLRWARAITGRSAILVFDGCYHGAVDDTLVDHLDSGAVVDRPSALGGLHSYAASTRVVPFNDLLALERALADEQVAAVLAEPALTNCGLVLPKPDFWTQAQALCQRHKTLLIMDETHTVSTACGGWARAEGLVPDFLVVGKAIAAGLPCAVYGFTAEVAQRMQQAKLQAPPGHSGIGTTLSGNMLALAALQASLTHLHTPTTYALMQAGADRLATGLKDRITQAGLPWTVTQLGARMELQFVPRPPRNARDVRAADTSLLAQCLHLFMLNRGIVLTPFHNMMLVSPATTDTAIDQLLGVFDSFIQALRNENLAPTTHFA